jgi:3-methyladenine DNA glycosylase/8-oxoguanine DNA glycosylase
VTPDHRVTVAVDGPLDLLLTLAPLSTGAADIRLSRSEAWRTSWMPVGAATLHLRAVARDRLEAEAWGPGAAAALDAVPALLGTPPAAAGFAPADPLMRDLLRRHPGVRIPRTGQVVAALVPAITAQKVVGLDARRSWRVLVRRLGTPAPGPAPLLLPPPAHVLATTPSWVFHQAGVERQRADIIRRVASVARRMEEAASMPRDDAYARLQAVPGIGPWTAAEAALIAFGDEDAVSVGDYHLPSLVTYMLAGEPRGTDERMLELLEAYRPHRARAVRLLELSGRTAPRRGPRMPRRWVAAE